MSASGTSERRNSELAGWARALGRDPVTRAGLGLFAAISLVYLLPGIPRETLRAWSGGVFLFTLALWPATAAYLRFRRVEHPEERRYWILIGGAFTSWAVATGMAMLPFWETRPPVVTLAYDLLFVAFSLMLILAATEVPHRPPGWRRVLGLRPLVYAGAVIFGVGTTVYFDLLPFLFDRAEFDSRVPAYLLFLALDGAILVRVAALFRAAPDRRWRIQYGALLATAVFNAGGDFLDALTRMEVFAYESPAWDFVWYAIFPPLALAARLPEGRRAPTSRVDFRRSQFGTPLITFALLVPLIHFSNSFLVDEGLSSDRSRRTVALVTMVTLLALARLQEARLEQRSRELELEVERARERLSDAERLEAVGRLAGGVAHEFNNKLAVILGYLEELAAESKDRPHLAEALEAIQRAADHSALLTSKLLAVGRRRVVSPEPIDVDEALTELTPSIQRALAPYLTLTIVRAPKRLLARADRGGLESALVSLALNSAEAIGERGGRVTVTPSVVDVGPKEVPPLSSVSPGRFVRIELGDDGPGASAEVVEHLFEPFFTTHPFGSGRGLGLASVRGIVEQCGGFVTVDTAPGRGFRCRLHYPRAPESSSGLRVLPPADAL